MINKNLLSNILGDIEFCVKNNYSENTFKEFIKRKYGDSLSKNSIMSIMKLYEKILDLERKGKNKIWTRILKNSFAPLLIGKFDYVIGNPPWINWENLPEFYRNETRSLWNWYGLLKRTKGMGLGKVKRDMAMLFIARCLDRFTKEGGKFGFLLPFTAFKTQAGAGFRSFLARGIWRGKDIRCPCKVLKVHDLVTLYPFEGAVNRTAMIIIEKAGKTEFPIPCIMWYNPGSKGIDQEAELNEVRKITKQFDLVFIPIERNKPESPWMQITKEAYQGILKVIGGSPWYKAHAGVYTGADAVFWVSILKKMQEHVLIQNVGKTTKSDIRIVRKAVEKNAIYPLIRGKNIQKWFLKPEGWILLPTDDKGNILPESVLKVKYPRLYEYFHSFYDILKQRSAYKQLFLKGKKPPYSVLNSRNAIAPYKVVWKEIAGGITGKAVKFSAAVAEPVEDEYFGLKPIIISHTVISIPLPDKQEAYYVCGVLNSSITLLAIASYTYELRMESHILKYLYIPKFDKKNPLHQRLSKLSIKAHEIAKQIHEKKREDLREELTLIEEEIDKIVAQLYGLTDRELKEIRNCLKILKEGEVEEEEKVEEEIVLPKEENVKVTLEPLLIEENKSQEIKVEIINNLRDTIHNIGIKISLKGKPVLKGKLSEIKSENKEIISFTLPKLRKGQYTLEISLRYERKGKIIPLKIKKTLFVKSGKPERKAISTLDEELEELLR